LYLSAVEILVRSVAVTEPTDLAPQIATNAALPSRTVVDGVEVQERPLAELIAADKYLQQKAAASSVRRGGLPFVQVSLRPPGATGAT
jgi:hypothetical protein